MQDGKTTGKTSALDGADGQAFDKIALNQWVKEDNGAGYHAGHGHAHAGGRKDNPLRRLKMPRSNELLEGLGGCEHVLEEILEGVHFFPGGEEHGIVPVIPVGQRGEQTDGRQERLRDREIKPEENGQLPGSVNLGRLRNLIRDAPHIVLGDDHVPYREGHREDETEICILEMEHLSAEHVPGDQAAAEERGEKEEKRKLISPLKVPT